MTSLTPGNLLYAAYTPTTSSGLFPLTINDTSDTLLDEIAPGAGTVSPTTPGQFGSAVMAQHGSLVLFSASGWGGIGSMTSDGATFATYIPSADITPSIEAMREDNRGRLVIVGSNASNNCQRFNADLTTDVLITLSSPVPPNPTIAIHPNGRYVYATTPSGGDTTIRLWRWDIDAGSSAGTEIATITGIDNFGTPGIAVHRDGTVVLVYESVVKTVPFPTTYTRTFWMRTYDEDGTTLNAFDLSSGVPNMSTGLLDSNSDINDTVEFNRCVTDPTTGYVWFTIRWLPTNDRYVLRSDITSGGVAVSNVHPQGGNTQFGSSRLWVYGEPEAPGLSMFRKADAVQTFFVGT